MAYIEKVPEKELEDISGGSGKQYYVSYCVVRGDTLERIAGRFKTTADMITVMNPIITDGSIRCGWTLTIPDNR